ncbi:MAG TPA: alpha/beta fold hydrolase [Pseudonocardiaceae bacterium]|nr:alpha/beta fold hydrolase [Pseudonocardiaceae bacterium]
MAPNVAEEDLWIRCFHPAPQRPISLFCLPHAGGSASNYFAFSAAVGEVAEVFAVQYPGRQDRWQDKPLADLRELAAPIADALAAWGERPLALFGHSMGSALAFELTRSLEQRGIEPLHLFASGGRAPALPRDEKIHLLDDEGLITEMKALGGTDPRLFDEPDLLEMVLPAVRADYTAIETYLAEPGATVRAPITVLTGEADPRTTVEQAKGWQQHTTGEFDLRVFPGGHFFLYDQVPEIARTVLDRLRSDQPG